MIFKKGLHEQFTIIDNQAILDNRISAKAKGILLYLMSRPDDWQIYESEIQNHFTDGISSIRSGIKELTQAGYISRSAQHDGKGKFAGYEYLVYDKPQNQAVSTIIRKSDNGKSHTTNIDKTKDRNNKKEIQKKKLSANFINRVKSEKEDRQIKATYQLVRAEQIQKQA